MINNGQNQQTKTNIKIGEARAAFATYGQWKQRLHINWTDNFYMSVESSPKRYLTQWNKPHNSQRKRNFGAGIFSRSEAWTSALLGQVDSCRLVPDRGSIKHLISPTVAGLT